MTRTSLLISLFLLIPSGTPISCYKCIVEHFAPPTPPSYYTVEQDEWNTQGTTQCLENAVECGAELGEKVQCATFKLDGEQIHDDGVSLTHYDCVLGDDDACEASGYDASYCTPVLCGDSLCNAPPKPSCPTCSGTVTSDTLRLSTAIIMVHLLKAVL